MICEGSGFQSSVVSHNRTSVHGCFGGHDLVNFPDSQLGGCSLPGCVDDTPLIPAKVSLDGEGARQNRYLRKLKLKFRRLGERSGLCGDSNS